MSQTHYIPRYLGAKLTLQSSIINQGIYSEKPKKLRSSVRPLATPFPPSEKSPSQQSHSLVGSSLTLTTLIYPVYCLQVEFFMQYINICLPHPPPYTQCLFVKV